MLRLLSSPFSGTALHKSNSMWKNVKHVLSIFTSPLSLFLLVILFFLTCVFTLLIYFGLRPTKRRIHLQSQTAHPSDCLLSSDTVHSCRRIPTFQMSRLPLSSESYHIFLVMDANVQKENATPIFRTEAALKMTAAYYPEKLVSVYNAICTLPETGRPQSQHSPP